MALARFLAERAGPAGDGGDGRGQAYAAGAVPGPALVRAFPSLPRIHDLTLAGRPRPVTPAYVMLSTALQPELSAAIVGVKTPEASVAQARRRLEFLLAGLGG